MGLKYFEKYSNERRNNYVNIMYIGVIKINNENNQKSNLWKRFLNVGGDNSADNFLKVALIYLIHSKYKNVIDLLIIGSYYGSYQCFQELSNIIKNCHQMNNTKNFLMIRNYAFAKFGQKLNENSRIIDLNSLYLSTSNLMKKMKKDDKDDNIKIQKRLNNIIDDMELNLKSNYSPYLQLLKYDVENDQNENYMKELENDVINGRYININTNVHYMDRSDQQDIKYYLMNIIQHYWKQDQDQDHYPSKASKTSKAYWYVLCYGIFTSNNYDYQNLFTHYFYPVSNLRLSKILLLKDPPIIDKRILNLAYKLKLSQSHYVLTIFYYLNKNYDQCREMIDIAMNRRSEFPSFKETIKYIEEEYDYYKSKFIKLQQDLNIIEFLYNNIGIINIDNICEYIIHLLIEELKTPGTKNNK